MNISDYIIWRIIKPILELRVNNFIFYFIIVILLFPITWTFWEMKDFWNVLNYTFVIPYTVTAGRRLLNELNISYNNSIININQNASGKIKIQNIKIVKLLPETKSTQLSVSCST